MMERKKDQKIASAPSHEPDSNDLLNKEEVNQPNVALAVDSMAGAISASNDNVPSVLQWPHTSQYNIDQPLSTSKPCVSFQSTSTVAVSQWHQLPQLPLCPVNQQGQPLPHLAHPFTSFLLPHPHPGYHLPGVNASTVFQPFTPGGNVNANQQAPGLIGGGGSLKDHAQLPNFGQFGYVYPGFPGPWDPSAWWGQPQLLHPSSTYSFSGLSGNLASQPSIMPGSSTSVVQTSQKGIIRPPAKLSQKHQMLWEAQSAENVRLWTVIGQLQTDIADYKSRTIKLEAEVSSLKQAIEELTAHVIGTAVSRQPSKRGRPRRSAASVDALHSPDEIKQGTRGRKPKAQIFEKVILNKAENKVKAANATAIAQQGENKVSNAIRNNISDSGTNGSNLIMSSFCNQVHQENNKIQMCEVELSTSLDMKINEDKIADMSDALAILAQHAKGMDHRTALAACHAARNNGSLGWPCAMPSEGNGRNIMNLTSKGFYNNVNVFKESEKVIPGWDLVHEEDASEELEDTMVASAKDDNEEEMGDDGSSGGEEIPCSEGKNLSQLGSW